MNLATVVMLLTVNRSPMESFQANSLTARIEMNYEVNIYEHHARTGDLLSFLQNPNESFNPEKSNFILEGSWSTDGAATSYLQRTIGGKRFDQSGKTGIAVDSTLFITAKSQTLQYLGTNKMQEPVIVLPRSEKYPVPCYGSWTYGSFQRFDSDFALKQSDYSKDIAEIRYQNKPMIAEQYRATKGEATSLKKIVYNPNEGYHPVFIRNITIVNDSSSIQDIYILKTTKTSKGGYFATLWYKVSYSADNLANTVENEIHLIQIPYSGVPNITRFESKKWEEIKKPLAFQKFSGSEFIFTPKDPVRLKSPTNKEIAVGTLDTLAQRLPNAEDLKKRATQNIDPIDNDSPPKQKNGTYKIALIILTSVICLLGSIFYLRKDGGS